MVSDPLLREKKGGGQGASGRYRAGLQADLTLKGPGDLMLDDNHKSLLKNPQEPFLEAKPPRRADSSLPVTSAQRLRVENGSAPKLFGGPSALMKALNKPAR